MWVCHVGGGKTSDDEMMGEGRGEGGSGADVERGMRVEIQLWEESKLAVGGGGPRRSGEEGERCALAIRVSIDLSMCIHKGTNSSGLRVVRLVGRCGCLLLPSVLLHVL